MAEQGSSAPDLADWVAKVDAHWKALGVSGNRRAQLRHDLAADLQQAIRAGASADELASVNPRQFALDVVSAEDLKRAMTGTSTTARALFIVVVLIGAILGALISLVTVYPVAISLVDSGRFDQTTQMMIAFGAHLTACALAIGVAALAVGYTFRRYRSPGILALKAAAGLATSGVVAATVTVAYAETTGYSNGAHVQYTEGALVCLVCALGMAITSRFTRVERSHPGNLGRLPGA